MLLHILSSTSVVVLGREIDLAGLGCSVICRFVCGLKLRRCAELCIVLHAALVLPPVYAKRVRCKRYVSSFKVSYPETV